MKVLLINPPFISMSEIIHKALPFGIAYLASYVESNGHRVDVMDVPMEGAPTKLGKNKQWRSRLCGIGRRGAHIKSSV